MGKTDKARLLSTHVLTPFRTTLIQQGWKVAVKRNARGVPADFWASLGKQQFCVRVHLQEVSEDLLLAQQNEMSDSGIRCLWFLEQPTFPVARDFPALMVHLNTPRTPLWLPSSKKVAVRNRAVPEHWAGQFSAKAVAEAISQRKLWFGLIREGETLSVRADGTLVRCFKCNHIETYPTIIEAIHKGRSVLVSPVAGMPLPALLTLLFPDLKQEVTSDSGRVFFRCSKCRRGTISIDAPGVEDGKPFGTWNITLTRHDSTSLDLLGRSVWNVGNE